MAVPIYSHRPTERGTNVAIFPILKVIYIGEKHAFTHSCRGGKLLPESKYPRETELHARVVTACMAYTGKREHRAIVHVSVELRTYPGERADCFRNLQRFPLVVPYIAS